MTEDRKFHGVRCALCQTVIVSQHRYDWVQCPCGESYVDGGQRCDYWRFGGHGECVKLTQAEYTAAMAIAAAKGNTP